jgi:hypothetical protein
MMLFAVFASVFAADDFHITPCRQSLTVDLEVSATLFDGGQRLELESCGSGIADVFYEDGSRKVVAKVAVESLDGKRVRVVVDDSNRGIRAERSDIALDTPTEFETGSKNDRLGVRVVVRKGLPQPNRVTTNVVNKPTNVVVERLEAVSGWTVRGQDLVGTNRVTLQFDAIPTRSMLELLADVGEVNITDVGHHVVEFTRKAAK